MLFYSNVFIFQMRKPAVKVVKWFAKFIYRVNLNARLAS